MCLTVATAFLGVVQGLSPPGCQTGAAPSQTTLSSVRTVTINLPGDPFAVTYAKSIRNIAFVSLNANDPDQATSLGVLNTTAFTPTLIHQIPLPSAYTVTAGANGLALTHDGRHLLVAAGPGAVVVDAARAAAGHSDAAVGTLNGTVGRHPPGTQDPGVLAIEVTISPDDRYAFVSQEYGSGYNHTNTPGNVDVFKLKHTSDRGLSGRPIGYLNLSDAVVGTALSPDGRTMYATSEALNLTTNVGTLSVIDVATLETRPSDALRTTAIAGCNPVRTIVSSDGRIVWVTARASNYLLAFDAAKLASTPDSALIASVQVGTLPVGLAFVRNETRIITADSNRKNITGAVSGLSVVDVDAALAGSPSAVLGRIPTGLFPRELAVSPDGMTLLVADHDSQQIQAVDISSLP